MFASLASHGGFFRRRSNASRAEEDLQALLARMRQRLYPETIPALASFGWRRSVRSAIASSGGGSWVIYWS